MCITRMFSSTNETTGCAPVVPLSFFLLRISHFPRFLAQWYFFVQHSLKRGRGRSRSSISLILLVLFSPSPCPTYHNHFPPLRCWDKMLHGRLVGCCIVFVFLICACFALTAIIYRFFRVPHPWPHPLPSPQSWGRNSIVRKGVQPRPRSYRSPPH